MPMFGMFLLINIFGCTNEKNADSTLVCLDPVAEAGSDLTIQYGDPIVLDGSASNWCLEYEEDVVLTWEFVSVPASSVVNENALSENRTNAAISPQFIPDVIGEYVLSLEINDGIASSNVDYIVAHVVAGDTAPTADCGGVYSGEIGQLVIIDGSASFDPEVTELDYSWSLTGPLCSSLTSESMYNQGTATPNFVPDCSGLFVVAVVVSDGAQWSEPAICSVDVSPENRIPVADAGGTVSYGGCANNPLQLNGYGSYDTDGDELSFTWSLVSTPTGSIATNSNFDDIHSKTPMFTWDIPGEYIAQLQVNDGEVWSAPDLVVVSIGELSENSRPTARVDSTLDLEVTANCQNTSYSTQCSQCGSYTIPLDGSASDDEDGDTLSFNWSESNNGSCSNSSPSLGSNSNTTEQDCIDAQGTWVSLDVDSPSSAVSSTIIPPQDHGTTLVFEIGLEVSDCQQSHIDVLTINYSCTAD